MKYKNVFGAYGALQKMMGMDFDARTAYAMYGLFKKIESVAQFGAKRERDTITKYDGVLRDDGVIEFIHGDDEESKEIGTRNMQAFAKDISELYEMEISDMNGIEPIVLKYDSFGDKKIAPSDFMALDGLVSFE